jgi:hypothetical protein
MTAYCKDKMIDALVKDLRVLGWGYRRRGKHGVLIAPGGRRLSVPSTPSDWRAYKNFRRDVRAVQFVELQRGNFFVHGNSVGAKRMRSER